MAIRRYQFSPAIQGWSCDVCGNPLNNSPIFSVHQAPAPGSRASACWTGVTHCWYYLSVFLLDCSQKYQCLTLSEVFLTPRCPEGPPWCSTSTSYTLLQEELSGCLGFSTGQLPTVFLHTIPHNNGVLLHPLASVDGTKVSSVLPIRTSSSLHSWSMCPTSRSFSCSLLWVAWSQPFTMAAVMKCPCRLPAYHSTFKLLLLLYSVVMTALVDLVLQAISSSIKSVFSSLFCLSKAAV